MNQKNCNHNSLPLEINSSGSAPILANKNNYSAAFLPFNLNTWHLLFYFLVIIICFLFFNQGDLNHTVRSSYAFLNGHIIDFYDYNKGIVGGNNYLPILYIIFAIWNIPIYILGLTSDLSNGAMFLNTVELVWSKLLLALFFAGTIFLLNKCAELLSSDLHKEKLSLYSALFATSPIAIFSVFIFSQYDIFGSFFTVLALYYYLKKNFTAFAWLFSIAIGFKFFALVIYLPLLIFAEKRVQHILKLLVTGGFITFFQFLIYWHSQAFQAGMLAIPNDSTGGLNYLNHTLTNPNTYCLIAYLFLCRYAYKSKAKDDNDFAMHAIFIPIAAYGLMFESIVWHPQWLIIIMPFFSLSYLFINKKRLFYIAEALGMLAFTWICVNQWVNNVDASMLLRGIFGPLFKVFPLYISDLMPPQFLLFFIIIFRIYLFAPILIHAIDKFTNYSKQKINNGILFYYVRFILGVSFFVIPSFFCALAPISLAKKISTEAFLFDLKKGLSLDNQGIQLDKLSRNTCITQKFKAEEDNLCAISLLFSTYMAGSDSVIKISLQDINGVYIYNKLINKESVKSNRYYSIYFPTIKNSKSQNYILKISLNEENGKSVIIWKNNQPYNDGSFFINNTKTNGSLCMCLYYRRD